MEKKEKKKKRKRKGKDKKGNKIAGMTTHYIQYKHKEIMVPLFKSLVRAISEYGNAVPCLIIFFFFFFFFFIVLEMCNDALPNVLLARTTRSTNKD